MTQNSEQVSPSVISAIARVFFWGLEAFFSSKLTPSDSETMSEHSMGDMEGWGLRGRIVGSSVSANDSVGLTTALANVNVAIDGEELGGGVGPGLGMFSIETIPMGTALSVVEGAPKRIWLGFMLGGALGMPPGICKGDGKLVIALVPLPTFDWKTVGDRLDAELGASLKA